ncbi:hypothetical protein FRB94_004725 [Tulasnella sp. JGI-2019a]|nr:hypothetical protein FRB94_004725 [Tulasnella sp. JGI-2019a]
MSSMAAYGAFPLVSLWWQVAEQSLTNDPDFNAHGHLNLTNASEVGGLLTVATEESYPDLHCGYILSGPIIECVVLTALSHNTPLFAQLKAGAHLHSDDRGTYLPYDPPGDARDIKVAHTWCRVVVHSGQETGSFQGVANYMWTNKSDRELWTRPCCGVVLVSYVTSKTLTPVIFMDMVAVEPLEHVTPWLAGAYCWATATRHFLLYTDTLLDHQIVSFSPIEPLHMDEPGIVTAQGVLVNPTTFQLATQAMVDVMEYVNSNLKSETTEVKVGRKMRKIERLCFPREVIRVIFPDTGGRILLQASLERPPRK